MLSYLIKRIAFSVPTLLALLVITFSVLRLAPGGPFDGERVLPAEVQANLNHKYGLDRPVSAQLALWIGNVARGDLGYSSQYSDRNVTEVIGNSLPTSMGLGLSALALALFVGIPLGTFAAWKRNSIWDWGSMFIAVSGVSLPSYLLASLLILVFSIQLNWLPPALWEGPEYWILPMITLGARPAAMIARITRAAMLESLTADYIRTAYAKGLSPFRVVFKHALKNSLIPVVTIAGPIAAQLVTGSFLVEMVFQIPGLGKHFVSAVINRDYNLVMATTLLYGVILTLTHLITDLIYGWVDPRVRLT